MPDLPDLPGLPTGTVTFLFTDLEGSTRLLGAHPDAYREAVARHHALLQEAVAEQGGAVFETVGDAVYAAFAAPTDAVAAALAGQLALQAQDWGELGAGALVARMGLHTGEVEVQGGHYFGAPLYRCARLTATAHGVQTVLSGAAALVREARGGAPAAPGHARRLAPRSACAGVRCVTGGGCRFGRGLLDRAAGGAHDGAHQVRQHASTRDGDDAMHLLRPRESRDRPLL
jgi:class 3 adenylate cyclase